MMQMKLKKIGSYLLIVLVAFLWQAPAAAKNAKSTNSATERPNAHPSQGTGNWKAKRDKHQKAGPQNEKKKKTSKWLRLKK